MPSLQGIRLTHVEDGLLIHTAIANEAKMALGQSEQVAHVCQQLVRVDCGILARFYCLDPFIRVCFLRKGPFSAEAK